MLESEGCASMYGGGFWEMDLYSRVNCEVSAVVSSSVCLRLLTRLCAAVGAGMVMSGVVDATVEAGTSPGSTEGKRAARKRQTAEQPDQSAKGGSGRGKRVKMVEWMADCSLLFVRMVR
jgi:hypothetical protein